MNTESFERRHIGPTDKEIEKMLSLINAISIDELIVLQVSRLYVLSISVISK